MLNRRLNWISAEAGDRPSSEEVNAMPSIDLSANTLLGDFQGTVWPFRKCICDRLGLAGFLNH